MHDKRITSLKLTTYFIQVSFELLRIDIVNGNFKGARIYSNWPGMTLSVESSALICTQCSKKCQKPNRCRCQQRAVCPQHLGVGALAGRASSVRFSVSLKFPRAIQTEIVPALSSWLSCIEGMTTEDPFWVSSCFPSFPDSMWLHWRAISSAAASSSELAVVDWTRLLWSAYTSFHSSTSTTDEWNLFQTTTF